jgi:hypothetical protein
MRAPRLDARLSKLLLRQGIVYFGGRAWTSAHDAWLRRQHLEAPATRLAFESDYEAVLMVKARRDRLDVAITAMAADSEFTPTVHRLGCPRGVSTLTAFALAVEIGDWHRFTGNTIGSFVGLVPREYSSGGSRVQGSVTKTGNGHARRLLVEAAWHHRARYVAGKTMRDRWELAPAAARARGDEGNGDCTTGGSSSPSAASGTPSPTSRSPASWPAGAGRWPSWTTKHPEAASSTEAVVAARGATRDTAMSSRSPWGAATLDPRRAVAFLPNHRPAVPNPRISV